MKTLKQIKKIIFTSLFLIILAFSSIANAQGDSLTACYKGLKHSDVKSGTVYSLAPGIFEIFEKHYNHVKIRVLKTGGRAKAQVNIYLNNVYQGHLTFENGNYKREEVYTLRNAKGKMIKVEIVNQSVTNKFDYLLKTYKAQKRTLFEKKGVTLLPGQKMWYTKAFSCTKKYKFTIKRLQGNAKLRFVARNPISENVFYAVNMEPSETTKTITFTSPIKSDRYSPLTWSVINTSKNDFVGVEITGEVGYFKTKKTPKNKVRKYKKVTHKMNN